MIFRRRVTIKEAGHSAMAVNERGIFMQRMGVEFEVTLEDDL